MGWAADFIDNSKYPREKYYKLDLERCQVGPHSPCEMDKPKICIYHYTDFESEISNHRPHFLGG